MRWKWPWTRKAISQLDALAGDKPRPWECSKCHTLVAHNEFHQCQPPRTSTWGNKDALQEHIDKLRADPAFGRYSNQVLAERLERIEKMLGELSRVVPMRETGVDYSGKDPFGTAANPSMSLAQFIAHECSNVRRDINALGIQQNDAAAIRREHTDRLDELRKMLNDWIMGEELRRSTTGMEAFIYRSALAGAEEVTFNGSVWRRMPVPEPAPAPAPDFVSPGEYQRIKIEGASMRKGGLAAMLEEQGIRDELDIRKHKAKRARKNRS